MALKKSELKNVVNNGDEISHSPRIQCCGLCDLSAALDGERVIGKRALSRYQREGL